MTDQVTDRPDPALMPAMRLSLAVGIGMLVMKLTGWLMTGSAAIFSDAAESVVHNFAVVFALFSLWYSARPADREHPYGHQKISFFSAGFEGALIILAAIIIIVESIRKWIQGLSIENLGAGTLITVAAFVVNGVLGFYLIWRGRKHKSLILDANGRHVLTDSWTSLGVIVGLLLTKFTGWLPFDPICAILVALNILWAGGDLVRRSIRGLMDQADPETDRILREALERACGGSGVTFHELRHRGAGSATWVEVHLLFRRGTSLRQAHEHATRVERALLERLGQGSRVTTHLEPMDDHQRIHGAEPAHEPVSPPDAITR